jgi:hypothetical protein
LHILEAAWPGGCALIKYALSKSALPHYFLGSKSFSIETPVLFPPSRPNRARRAEGVIFTKFDDSTESPWTFTGLSGVSFQQVFEKVVPFEPVRKNSNSFRAPTVVLGLKLAVNAFTQTRLIRRVVDPIYGRKLVSGVKN